jgi:hypothetical protein
MLFESLDIFIKEAVKGNERHFTKSPLALIFAEDAVEIDSTIEHHLSIGFHNIILFGAKETPLSPTLSPQVHHVQYDTHAPNMLTQAVNKMIKALPGAWMYYCYNAEYLFFPFCETRSIADMLAFHTEERRSAMLSYTLDLYAQDLSQTPSAVSLTETYFDSAGYYALARQGTNGPKERQLDFFGGLRWRFEEHILKARRRIDRISIFKAKAGLELQENHTFNVEEYNTYACPWHHNLTATIGSFRTAKALKSNPGSSNFIHTFQWHNSAKFDWKSQQLMDLGLMEPGQWF